MNFGSGFKLSLALLLLVLFSTTVFADNTYDRELIVKGDKTRGMQVEATFKELMAAYEDEDAQGFLDLVSDDRFRQDYITFTDALYSDFRNYDINNVDYWIDRIVPDHVKQFLYVRWEKRYENLDDGQQMTTRGFSRFLFDDVEGKYMLVELAGNSLFGASLSEWNEELGQISGQEATRQDPDTPGETCDAQHLDLCDQSLCSSYGGYWYNNTCNNAPDSGQPDLMFSSVNYVAQYPSASDYVDFTVTNIGTGTSTATFVASNNASGGSVNVPALAPSAQFTSTISVNSRNSGDSLTVDADGMGNESDYSNNTQQY